MDHAKRKTIIASEIEQWRSSKLLPEQYCDFLFNLYGDDSVKRASQRKRIARQIVRTAAVWIACFGFVAIVYLFAVYFISFFSTKQIFIRLTDMKGKDAFPVFIIVGSILWISCGFFAGYFVHRLRVQGTSKVMKNQNRSV